MPPKNNKQNKIRMKDLAFILVCFIVFVGLNSCNGNQNATKPANTTTTKSEAAQPTEWPMKSLIDVINTCRKTEFQLYKLGISFETEDSLSAKRFYSYLSNAAVSAETCANKDYDGGVVLKDANGDIKLTFEINIPIVSKGCNRAYFKFDGKAYNLVFNDMGLQFFDSVLNNRVN